MQREDSRKGGQISKRTHNLFTKQDFATWVLGAEASEIAGKNSEHMASRDKVMPAKAFAEKSEVSGAIKLDNDSLENANSLFKLLMDKFSGL